jgi:hypothetical protein
MEIKKGEFTITVSMIKTINSSSSSSSSSSS